MLSDHEEEILAQIERQLAADDPQFVARTRRVAASSGDRRLALSIVGIVLGIASLLGLTFSLVFGVIGFGLLLVSVVTIVTVLRERDFPARLLASRGAGEDER